MNSLKIGKGFFLALLASFLWAVSIVFLRYILTSGENVYSVMFWMTVMSLPFWMIIFAINRKNGSGLERKDYLILAGIVLVSGVTQTVIDLLAVKYSAAINYSFLIRTVVIFTFVFSFFWLGEKITRSKVAIGLAIVAGAYLLTTEGRSMTLRIGDILVVIDAALISLGNSILSKMATNRMPPMFVVSATAIGAFLPETALALYLGRTMEAQNLLLVALLALLYLTLNSVRFLAYKYVSASFMAVMMSLTPVFVFIMAGQLLGESLSLSQIGGGGLIVAASMFAVKSKI